MLAAQQEKPKEKTPEELVPKEYHKFLKVFLKQESECMPQRKPWDHAIDLKDTFKPKKGHIIPLSPAEQEEVTIGIASSDQVQRQQRRDEPVRGILTWCLILLQVD